MRFLLAFGLVGLVACGSERSNRLNQTDTDGSGDTDATATCEDLYNHVDGCFSDDGCSNLFPQSPFVSSCNGAHFTGTEIGDQVAQSCSDLLQFYCTHNNSLFTVSCCQAFFTCPDNLVCEPLDGSNNQAGVCVTAQSSFPADAQTCSAPGDCQGGFICAQGATSTKCVQVCAP